MTPKIAHFLIQQTPSTPCLVVDTDRVKDRYLTMKTHFPTTDIYYAVKANPAKAILKQLVALGSHFDAASWEEIVMCLDAGAKPDSISFGHTIKKVSSIDKAFKVGINMFAFDSIEELQKLAQHAPGTRVYCRLLVENKGADWPLSCKFGTSTTHAHSLLLKARDMGLKPVGLSFHVGSQQTCPSTYATAIELAASLFYRLTKEGLQISLMNLGGGFPIRYSDDVPEIGDFATTIKSTFQRLFGTNIPQLIVEPGRFIVGEAGVIVSEIVLISHRGNEKDPRWMYLDIGRFGGLAETEGEAIRYQIKTPKDGAPTGRVIIAGPTCDGADVMYKHTNYQLPLNLSYGDRIQFLSTGAYVSTYCSTGFNGFPPLTKYYI